MRVVSNRRLITRRARLGKLATIGGFAILMGGLAYSFLVVRPGEDDGSQILVSYAALIVGYFLISTGRRPWLQFAVHPRPDEALAIHLKALDNRNLLFNYMSSIPVEHLLLSPGGLVVIETRPLIGDIVVRGERWSRRRGIMGWLQFVSEGPLGNPSKDAFRGVASVKEMVRDRLGAEAVDKIPVAPLVVFTHPRVTLTIDSPTVPVVYARDSRAEVKRLTSGKAPGDLLRKLEYALVQDAAPEGEPVNAGEAVDRRARRRVSRPTRAR